MKVYIASSFKLITKVKEIAKRLEEKGHTITVKWWERVYVIDGVEIITTELKVKNENLEPDIFYALKETRLSYWSDFHGIKDADILIFVASDYVRKYSGANVELGIALSDKKPCYLIGSLKNSALYYPLIRCIGIATLIKRIEDDE